MTARIDQIAFGHQVRSRRRALHLTQEELAELADVCQQYIGNIERGKSLPSMPTFLSLCYALRINPDSLLIDSLPEDGFHDETFCKLRSPRSIYCNTFYDWYLSEDDILDDAPVDLSKLPPIGFMGLDEDFPRLN